MVIADAIELSMLVNVHRVIDLNKVDSNFVLDDRRMAVTDVGTISCCGTSQPNR